MFYPDEDTRFSENHTFSELHCLLLPNVRWQDDIHCLKCENKSTCLSFQVCILSTRLQPD